MAIARYPTGERVRMGDRVSFPIPAWSGWERLTGTVDVSEPDARGYVRVNYDGAYTDRSWHHPGELILNGSRIPLPQYAHIFSTDE
jgi:hypothetical protein